MKTYYYLIIILLLNCLFVKAGTSRSIYGKITSETDGCALAGANVVVKNTTRGTITDLNGKFKIEIENTDSVLVISLIGYETLEVAIDHKYNYEITLKEERDVIEEVVVVGYGKSRKGRIKGAISRIGDRSSASSKRSRTGKRSGDKTSTREASIHESRESEIIGEVAETRKTELPAPAELERETTEERDFKPPCVKIKGAEITKDIQQNNAGVLTAGEWNDLNHWQFWQSLMQSDEWSHIQSHWRLTLDNRITVVVKNTKEIALADVQVLLRNPKGKTEWLARTDNAGAAELFPGIFGDAGKKYNLIVRHPNGEEKIIKDVDLQKKVHYVVFDQAPEFYENLDVMFAVDATGSMGDELEFLKNELVDIINKVHNRSANLQTRVGMVFYRDRGDEYVVRDFEFNSDLQTVKKNLNQQYAGGGGDYEEAVDEALQNAVEQKRWSDNANARLLFLILDAPPHHNNHTIERLQKTIYTASQKGIKVIPIVASGIDKNTEFLMRLMATATNGTYVFLTDDSGVGGSHLEPTIGRHQVEKLNDLMVRLILKYTNQLQ